MITNLFYTAVSPETAYIINDYPWGWTLKTQQKVWIETDKKHGDRIVRQTLNPKNNVWCKPKKSTYEAIMVMGFNEENHISHIGLWHSASAEEVNKFLSQIDKDKLTEAQKNQLRIIIARNKVYENVTFTVKNVTGQTDEEREAHRKEQEAIQHKINNAIYHEYKNTKV